MRFSESLHLPHLGSLDILGIERSAPAAILSAGRPKQSFQFPVVSMVSVCNLAQRFGLDRRCRKAADSSIP